MMVGIRERTGIPDIMEAEILSNVYKKILSISQSCACISKPAVECYAETLSSLHHNSHKAVGEGQGVVDTPSTS